MDAIESMSLKSATLLPLIFAAAPPVAVIVKVSVLGSALTLIPVPPVKVRVSVEFSATTLVVPSPTCLNALVTTSLFNPKSSLLFEVSRAISIVPSVERTSIMPFSCTY